YTAAGNVPIVLHNDMHALALAWLLTSVPTTGGVLPVGTDAGRPGASVLIDGRPHRGSVSAATELGHTRLAVETAPCSCGAYGCLERIVSTPQLRRMGAKSDRTLDEVLAAPGRDAAALNKLLNHLAMGLSNAVNFIRPARLVIASPLVRHGVLKDYLRT